ncbi:MAG: flagellar motor switch protein FliN [Thermovirgaceae bacterium]
MADEKHQKDMNPEEGTPDREEPQERESSGDNLPEGETVDNGEAGDGEARAGGNAETPAETGGEDQKEDASRESRSAPETGAGDFSDEESEGEEGETKQPEGASISAEEAAALEKGLDWLDSVGEDIPDIPDYEEVEKKGGGEETSQAAIDDLISSVKANSGFNFETNPSGAKQQPGRHREPEGSASVQPASFPDMNDEGSGERKDTGNENKIDMLMDIPVQVTVVLGHAQKTIGEIVSLEQGAVVELDKIVGEPVDVLANGKLVFKGEVVVIDENFGVRVVELVKSPIRNAR